MIKKSTAEMGCVLSLPEMHSGHSFKFAHASKGIFLRWSWRLGTASKPIGCAKATAEPERRSSFSKPHTTGSRGRSPLEGEF